ncbi:DgyrCDS2935 [Dimorphilus gyrociliatus]|uniref:DgyrCDS2935 n=1 Tax=Dimorphilus gyrociliatus TaxID=2664684 RepID=A0A7I8VBP7_9ANNE|nr:DgyrCDS2935 [Dimorphilus gyrociliatus]
METHNNPAFVNDEKIPPNLYDEALPTQKESNGINNFDKRNGSPKVAPLEGQTSVDEELRKKMDQEPLRFCKFITDRPKLAFGITLGAHIFFAVLTLILIAGGVNIFPIVFDRLPLDITNDEHFLRSMAWFERDKPDYMISRGEDKNTKQKVQTIFYSFMELNFVGASGDNNVFTEKNLKLIKKIQDKYINTDDYKNSFCLKRSDDKCSYPTSVLALFEDGDYSDIAGRIYAASKDDKTAAQTQYFLSKDAEITPTRAFSSRTRIRINIGGPLKGFDRVPEDNDDDTDMNTKYENLLKEFANIGDDYFKNGVGDMEFYHFCPILLGVKIRSTVFRDLSLALGSMLFIVVFMLIQTQSVWITLWAVFSILNSFLITNLLYNGVIRFTYLGIFHVLAIFIILGIGADNVFVFYDTWRESAHHKYISMAHRLSHCYRKATMAMFYTSLTTALAFIVSATSPFMAVYTFGVFSGILIVVNYLSVIIFFPCVVVTYTLFWSKFKCCCCCNRELTGGTIEAPEGRDDNIKRNFIVRFFAGPYYKFITHKIAKWFILVFYAGLLAAFIYFASTLEVNQEETKFLKDSSNYGRYLYDLSREYKGNRDRVTAVYLAFGLKEQDRSDCYHTDYKCNGVQNWDNKFNLNKKSVQDGLTKFCQELKALTPDEISDLHIRTDINHKDKPEVLCFIDNMKSFYKSTPLKLSKSYDVFDVNSANDIFNTDTTDLYDKRNNLKGEAVNKHFELAMNWWLFNGNTPPPGTPFAKRSDDFILFNDLLGEEKLDGSVTYQKNDETRIYGTHLKYAAIVINTTLEINRIGFEKGLPVRDKWEDFINKKRESLPEELKGVWQTAITGQNSIWHWLQVQNKLVGSAVTGIAIGIGLSCPILIVATHNVIVGLLATFTIGCVTVCVIGVLPIAGWKLGLLESLNLVLVVGLAVDYIVHLAEGYSRSVHRLRKDRVRDMLTEVGVSVLSGATTTLGASFFLLLAEILFFVEFGAFMFATIGFSILWALGFFSTVLGILGPQNDVGSLKPIYRWLSSKCPCGRSKSENL